MKKLISCFKQLFSAEYWYINRIIGKALKDHCVMVLPTSLGDLLFVLNNLKKIEKAANVKIFPVIKKDRATVAELCGCKDVFAVSNLDLIPKLPCVKMLFRSLLGRQVIKKLKPDVVCGNIVFAHPDFYSAFRGEIPAEIPPIPELFRIFFKMSEQMTFPAKLVKLSSDTVDIAAAARSILLCPQAITVDGLPQTFWNTLAAKLEHAGWQVFYNAIQPIPAFTHASWLDCSLRDAVVFGQNAAFVVSLRSGYCDLLADKGDRLIVIYPDILWRGERSFLEIFDLNEYFSRTDIPSCLFKSEKDTLDFVLQHIHH